LASANTDSEELAGNLDENLVFHCVVQVDCPAGFSSLGWPMTKSSSSTLQPGDVLLEKYRVERVLGRGGMGMVLAVRHMQLGELFAIKIMLPEMLEHPDAVGRFLREARASARLRAEHVARVHDVGTLENGVPYMVLEFLDGTDLDHWVTTRGKLGVGEAAAYVYQVCEALVEAHGQGIVHRDLKPANLFLTRKADGSASIKVLDFGISKDITRMDTNSAKLTKTGAIMGSPHYMSPEQLVDGKNVDARSDLWALGIILYELVTGTMPFNADSMPEVIAKVLTVNPPPPSQVCPGIDPNFDELVKRCMERDRDRRFQSVQEVMQALAPFVNMAEIPQLKPLSLMPPPKSASDPTLTPSALEWGQSTASSDAPTLVQVSPRSSRRIVGITAIAVIVLGLGLVGFVVRRPNEVKMEMPTNPAPSSSFVANDVAVKEVLPVATSAEVPVLASSAATPNKSVVTAAVVKTTPPPVVSATTTTKTKNKVKGFDE
jgi:serine/threonine protein kinase